MTASDAIRLALPHSRLDIIDAGPFTWEDVAHQYAVLVTSWWAAGDATVDSAAADYAIFERGTESIVPRRAMPHGVRTGATGLEPATSGVTGRERG
jgi:hypothetical protein